MSDLCTRLKIAARREEDRRQRDGFCGDAEKSLYWEAANKIAELEAELERTTNAIHQYMQTTSQRGPKRALVENFVGMYTYKARTTSAGGEG